MNTLDVVALFLLVIAGRDSYGEHTGTTIYMGSNKSDDAACL